MSPAYVADLFSGLDEETRKKLRSLPSNDEVLAEAFRQSRVVVGQAGAAAPPTDPTANSFRRPGSSRADRIPGYLLSFPGLLRNIPVIEEGRPAAASPDDQARAGRRRAPRAAGHGRRGDFVPAMTLELLRVVTGSGPILIRSDEAGIAGIGLRACRFRPITMRIYGSISVPTTGRATSLRSPVARPHAVDRFAGRLVLVGTSAIGLLGIKTTPVDAAIPGVEVNAQIIENILTNAALWRPNFAIGAELSTAPCFSAWRRSS